MGVGVQLEKRGKQSSSFQHREEDTLTNGDFLYKCRCPFPKDHSLQCLQVSVSAGSQNSELSIILCPQGRFGDAFPLPFKFKAGKAVLAASAPFSLKSPSDCPFAPLARTWGHPPASIWVAQLSGQGKGRGKGKGRRDGFQKALPAPCQSRSPGVLTLWCAACSFYTQTHTHFYTLYTCINDKNRIISATFFFTYCLLYII